MGIYCVMNKERLLSRAHAEGDKQNRWKQEIKQIPKVDYVINFKKNKKTHPKCFSCNRI